MPTQSIEVYLSGGATNSDTDLSLGGVLSSVKHIGNTVSYTSTTIAGVTLIDSSGFKENGAIGTISFTDADIPYLFYTKLNGATPPFEYHVDVSVDGRYIIVCPEEDATITVEVVNASFGSDKANIPIEQVLNSPNLFADILENEAATGGVKYRHLYLKNVSATTIYIKTYIASNYSGLDVLAIGFFSLTSGTEDELLVDENTAPISVIFKFPENVGEAEVLTISPGATLGVYFRREVFALSDKTTNPSSANLMIELVP